MNKVIIELKNIVKKFDDDVIVDGLNLKIYENEFITLLGPSGCGKTTTLRMIAGFEKPNEGQIVVNGKVVNDLPPYARPINTVFQRYALFPHLNVFDNVAFGLHNRGQKYLLSFYNEKLVREEIISDKLNKLEGALKEDFIAKRNKSIAEIEAKFKDLQNNINEKYQSNPEELKTRTEKLNQQKTQKLNQVNITYLDLKKKLNEKISDSVSKALELVKLKGYEKRRVDQLSGGQQQRVALARAIVNKPQILLLDEPLAALDLKLRQNMQYELKEMQKTLGITFIFVTHDQEEAMTMSDRVVVMKDGIIQQLGSPKHIYNEPVNRYVATFIGETNIIRGTYVKENVVKFMGVEFDCVGYKFANNETVDVVIRPEDFDVVPLDLAKLQGVVTSVVFKGVHNEIDVDIQGVQFTVNTYENYEVGQPIGLKVDPYEIHLMKVNENE